MALIVRAGVHGRGVFTDAAVPAGALLIAFTGPLLRYAETTPETLALQIAPDLYLGGSGGPDDCVNHSCAPNSGLVIRGTDVKLIAIRDIAAGEELFFDYSTTMDEDDFEFDCACGQSRMQRAHPRFQASACLHCGDDIKRSAWCRSIISSTFEPTKRR